MGKKQDLVKKLALEHLKVLEEAASPSAIRKSLEKIVAAAKGKLEPKPKPKRKIKAKAKRAMTQREEDLEKILQHEKAKSPFDDLPPLNERKWEVKNLEEKKSGGLVKKKRSVKKAKGVGAAKRGYGKAMR